MKKAIYYFTLFGLYSMNLFCFAQSSSRSSVNDLTVPIFIDNGRLAHDLVSDTDIKSILAYQKEYGMPDTYRYDFKIMEDGKIQQGTLETDSIYASINNFIKKKFNYYKWRPAHRKGCVKCKMAVYGTFNISFITIEDKVKLELMMFDGVIRKRINSKIVYSKILRI